MSAREQERQTKHQAVRRHLERSGQQAVLLGRRADFSWCTCGAHNHVGTACDVGSSWLVIRPGEAAVLVNNIEAPRLRSEALRGMDIEVIEYPYHDPDAGARALAQVTRRGHIAVDAAPPGDRACRRVGRDFEKLRWRLCPAEIERYRMLCDDAVAAVEAAARSAEPGQTEQELAGRADWELQRRGCPPWLMLVGGDERVERFRHPLPTSKPIRRYFMVAACAERDGLVASCTRVVSFEPVPRELRKRHEAAATVAAALVGATRPGTTLGEVFARGQAAYAAAGFADEWRLHHQGGSCGYQGRDVKASPGDTTEVLGDQAFAWNPSITGIKIERMILAGPDGPQSLAGPTDWPAIEGSWDGRTISCAGILSP